MAWMPYAASSPIAAVASCAPEALWQLWDSTEPQQLNHGISELCAGGTWGGFWSNSLCQARWTPKVSGLMALLLLQSNSCTCVPRCLTPGSCVVALGQASANWEQKLVETRGTGKNVSRFMFPLFRAPEASLLFVLCYVPCCWDFSANRVAEPLDELPVSRLWKGRGDMVPLGSRISGSYLDCLWHWKGTVIFFASNPFWRLTYDKTFAGIPQLMLTPLCVRNSLSRWQIM